MAISMVREEGVERGGFHAMLCCDSCGQPLDGRREGVLVYDSASAGPFAETRIVCKGRCDQIVSSGADGRRRLHGSIEVQRLVVQLLLRTLQFYPAHVLESVKELLRGRDPLSF